MYSIKTIEINKKYKALYLLDKEKEIISQCQYKLNSFEYDYRDSKELPTNKRPSDLFYGYLFVISKMKNLFIDQIWIEEKYLNQGYMRQTINVFKNIYPNLDIIYLRASPIREIDRTIENDRLLKDKYIKLGFIESEFDYMFLPLTKIGLDIINDFIKNKTLLAISDLDDEEF